MDPMVVFIIGTVALVGVLWYKKKKGGTGFKLNIPNPFAQQEVIEEDPNYEPKREIYIMLKYNKVTVGKKEKQPPPLFWREPFRSGEEIETWRDANPQLMEGVSEIVEV